MLESLLVGARFVHFGAAMMAFGACIFPAYAGTSPAFPMRAAAALALCSAIVWLLCVVLAVEEGGWRTLSFGDMGTVLLQTGFGRAWLVHVGLGMAWLGTSWSGWSRGTAIAAGAHLVSLAGIGHAAIGTGLGQIAHVIGHVTHLGAGGIWMGGLLLLWRACALAGPRERRKLIQRFSTVGYAAVTLVILSGITNLRFVTGTFWPSWHTGYGHLLTAKIGLVTGLVLIALFNQFVAARRNDWLLLRLGFIVELAAFCAILAIVSRLGIAPPA